MLNDDLFGNEVFYDGACPVCHGDIAVCMYAPEECPMGLFDWEAKGKSDVETETFGAVRTNDAWIGNVAEND